MDQIDALEAAIRGAAAVLDEVTAQDRTRPTPCVGWDLGWLMGHVVGVAEAFATVLAGGTVPARARVPADDASGDRLRAAGARSIAGWSASGALDREYDAVIELDDDVVIPPIAIPGSLLQSIHLLDIGVHLHDLAAAVGRPELAEDAELSAATLRSAEAVLMPGIRELVGFGPELPAPPGADATGRLLAFVGRVTPVARD